MRQRFEDCTTIDEIKQYLDDSGNRLTNAKYLYHYTTIDKLIKIYQSKLLFLSNADCMNDKLEYEKGDKIIWKKTLFASFMMDDHENVGMWSMYSQPWEKGVRIAIPKEFFKEWINGIRDIKEISCLDFTPTGNAILCDDNNKVFISAIAYSKTDNKAENNLKLAWNTTSNSKINSSLIKALTSYIKDNAWDYEKEIRIKAVIGNDKYYKKLAIDIPKDVFESFSLTASPLFQGDLRKQLEKELGKDISKKIKINESVLKGKLYVSSPCSDCDYKKSLAASIDIKSKDELT